MKSMERGDIPGDIYNTYIDADDYDIDDGEKDMDEDKENENEEKDD